MGDGNMIILDDAGGNSSGKASGILADVVGVSSTGRALTDPVGEHSKNDGSLITVDEAGRIPSGKDGEMPAFENGEISTHQIPTGNVGSMRTVGEAGGESSRGSRT